MSMHATMHEEVLGLPGTESEATCNEAVARAAREGLTASPKYLPAWLFYDEQGSKLFEHITVLPEYYLTRTERGIFTAQADAILAAARRLHPQGNTHTLRMLELGAGTATKTGILLAAAVRQQGATEYLPIDVSASAIDEACGSIERTLHDVRVVPQVANYVTDTLEIPAYEGPTLALYIGSSIGNFNPDEAVAILRNLRAQLRPGDSLLLGTDLVKDSQQLIAAYNDSAGVTAAFNLNMLHRLNHELDANFHLPCFRHTAIWNPEQSRMEMHLESTLAQTVHLPAAGITVNFTKGETIHTENSYKFTTASIAELMRRAGFETVTTWQDAQHWFAVTLAAVRG